MSDLPWDQPSGSGSWFGPGNRIGNLILVTAVHEITKAYDNLKEADVERAEFDFVDLDDTTDVDSNGLPVKVVGIYDNHAGVVNKLKVAMRTGRGVLGRMVEAPTKKGNAALVLGPYNEDSNDAERAKAWLDAQTRGKFSQPDNEPTPAKPAAKAATPAKKPAAKAAPAPTEAFTVNGVEVDPEQFVKLAALGIVTPTAEQAASLAALGHTVSA